MMYEELRRQIPIHFYNTPQYPRLLYVQIVNPTSWDHGYSLGLMQEDDGRWHSVDEQDDRHLESSDMMDVAYGLLVKRFDEEPEDGSSVSDFIDEFYPLADYSSLYKVPRNETPVQIFIRDYDFERLTTDYVPWTPNLGDQEGRFEKMVEGRTVDAQPEAAWEHAYWLRDAWSDVLLCGAFLDGQKAPYEVWWDTGGGDACYLILTNWASVRHTEGWERGDDGRWHIKTTETVEEQ